MQDGGGSAKTHGPATEATSWAGDKSTSFIDSSRAVAESVWWIYSIFILLNRIPSEVLKLLQGKGVVLEKWSVMESQKGTSEKMSGQQNLAYVF